MKRRIDDKPTGTHPERREENPEKVAATVKVCFAAANVRERSFTILANVEITDPIAAA